MLAAAIAAAVLLLAALADAGWVRPAPRFPEPSAPSFCAYACPVISGYTLGPAKGVAGVEESTTDCTYSTPTFVTDDENNFRGTCLYWITTGEGLAEGCPENIAPSGTCPQSFRGDNGAGLEGTFTYEENGSSGPLLYCYYTFASDETTVRGTCTYADPDGTLVSGSGTDPACPEDAPSQCLRKRTRQLTKLEATIRARQYKFPRPARQ